MHGHHSLQSQELRSKRSFKGRRSMTDLWNDPGLLPNENAAPTRFQKDTEDRTFKGTEAETGSSRTCAVGYRGRPEEGLVPPTSWVRGTCPLPRPPPHRLSPQSLEFKGASAPQHKHRGLPSGAKGPRSWPAPHPWPHGVGWSWDRLTV